MKLTKTPDGYVVQVPDDVVAALGLREGDSVKINRSGETDLHDDDRSELGQRIRELALPFPPGFKFDREEANSR